MPDQPNTEKQPKGRSPSYPGIDLERALGLAQILYQKSNRHEVADEVAWAHWGMKPRTGPAAVALAALKKFGLVDSEKKKVKLSALALDIILDERDDSTAKAKRIKEAALNPSIHEELWEKYKESGLPSDRDLRWLLTREHEPPFTETGADELIGEFRKTMIFAGFIRQDLPFQPPGDKLKGEKGRADSDAFASLLGMNMFPKPEKPPEQGPTTQEIKFAIPGPISAVVCLPDPLTEDQWKRMIAVLEAMKPAVGAPKKES